MASPSGRRDGVSPIPRVLEAIAGHGPRTLNRRGAWLCTHRGDPTAFVIGPTELVFNAKSNTLYVASTGDNAIYAIRGAGTTQVDRGTGKIIYQDSKHLHGPLGLTVAPDGNLIAAQGDAIIADPNQPSELVEFTAKGEFIGQFSINTGTGGAFGVATSSTRRHFAAVNDNTDSAEIWTVTA